ncbi:MAG: thiamine pyrophosphate-dependent enzyme, partial [Clostridia bacterium]|nr:thiamine pyrophosphate-dependent enzyme [Clostridia bacterium]
LNDFCTSSKWAYQNEDVEVLTINVNDFDSYKMNAFPVIADAKKSLEAISTGLKEKGYASEYTDEIQKVKEEWNQEVDRLYNIELDKGLSQTRVLGELNEKLTDHDAVVVTAAGSLPSDCQRVWRRRTDNIYHAEYAFSCMGYEVAGAIGAKLAEPDKEVYALLGDGSFLMLHTELVTSLQENIKINIILLDNHGYQRIHNLQRQEGIPSFANEFRYREERSNRLTGECMPIDFAKVAEGYGAKGFRAKNINEVQKAFKGMKASEVTSLMDIKVLPGTMTFGYDSWWRVGTAQISKHESVTKAAEKIKEQLKIAKQY